MEALVIFHAQQTMYKS